MRGRKQFLKPFTKITKGFTTAEFEQSAAKCIKVPSKKTRTSPGGREIWSCKIVTSAASKIRNSSRNLKANALKQSLFFLISFYFFLLVFCCLRATLCASFANLDQLSFLSVSAPPKYLALAMGCSTLACEEWLPRVP